MKAAHTVIDDIRDGAFIVGVLIALCLISATSQIVHLASSAGRWVLGIKG